MLENNKYYQGCLLAESEDNCYYFFAKSAEIANSLNSFRRKKRG